MIVAFCVGRRQGLISNGGSGHLRNIRHSQENLDFILWVGSRWIFKEEDDVIRLGAAKDGLEGVTSPGG